MAEVSPGLVEDAVLVDDVDSVVGNTIVVVELLLVDDITVVGDGAWIVVVILLDGSGLSGKVDDGGLPIVVVNLLDGDRLTTDVEVGGVSMVVVSLEEGFDAAVVDGENEVVPGEVKKGEVVPTDVEVVLLEVVVDVSVDVINGEAVSL